MLQARLAPLREQIITKSSRCEIAKKPWDAEKEKYQLTEIVAGVFAYSLKEQANSTAPSHRICTQC
jgi:hypothetical protein